jgi:hypothetical protein
MKYCKSLKFVKFCVKIIKSGSLDKIVVLNPLRMVLCKPKHM